MKAGWRDTHLVLRDLAKAIPIISANRLPLLTENNFKSPPVIWTPLPILLIFRLSAGPSPFIMTAPPIIWSWRV